MTAVKDRHFTRLLAGYSLTTAEILYRIPDYPLVLQSFIWQEYDVHPRFPRLRTFLEFWEQNLDGKLHSVTVAHRRLIAAAKPMPISSAGRGARCSRRQEGTLRRRDGSPMIVEPRRQIAARVVSSIEQALAKRHALMAAGDAGAVDELLHAMHTVKSARFNAAERLERKNTLSLFAMSMVSLYFVGLSVWQVIYAPLIADAGNRLITLVSIMSSVFTLVLALIEAMNDYRIKAYHMHACALAVNELCQELKLMRSGDV